MTRVHSWIKLLSTWCVGLLCALAFGSAGAVSGAISTTINPNVDTPPSGGSLCLNGNGLNNCNIYTDKTFVWLSGLPVSAALGDGTYFFAVLVPGGQGNNSDANPNDCTAKNLSDNCAPPWAAGLQNSDGTNIPTGDPYTNRMFHVTGGIIDNVFGSTHTFDSNKIRLMPYDDTTNPGGEYILAVCQVPDTIDPLNPNPPGIDPSVCKYDAFKIQPANANVATVNVCKFQDLNANGSQEDGEPFLFGWQIDAYGVLLGDNTTTGDTSDTTDQTGCTSFSVAQNNLDGSVELIKFAEVTQPPVWVQTAAYCPDPGLKCSVDSNGEVTISQTLVAGKTYTVYFGNFNTLEEQGELTVVKTAVPSPITWGVTKVVDDPTTVNIAAGGTATFKYHVSVSHDTTATLTGKIKITNTGGELDDLIVSDATDVGGTCTITDPTSGNPVNPVTGLTVAAGPLTTVYLDYTCTWTAPNIPTKGGNNTVKVLLKDNVTVLSSDKEFFQFNPTSVTVTDKFNGTTNTLGTVSVNDTPSPTVFDDTRIVSGVTGTCTKYDNTAAITTGDPPTNVVDPASAHTVTVCVGADLTAKKTASGSYSSSITKTANQSSPLEVTGATTLTFKVIVTESGWQVGGNITVYNPNDWETVSVNLSDALSDVGGNCTISGGSPQTVPAATVAVTSPGSISPSYTCTFASAPSATSGTNTATITWDKTIASTPGNSASPTAGYSFASLHVTDTCPGATSATPLGTIAGNVASTTYNPVSCNVTPPAGQCTPYTNTANTDAASPPNTNKATANVTVCNTQTGGLTMGFWQNKNGQGIITGGVSSGGACNSATYLRTYPPFQDLSATATCAAVGTYVTNVIKAANASGASMNAMLKAQMLATALDVFFSNPANGNPIKAPTPLGGVKIDLTQVCNMLDNTTTGSATCSGTYQNTGAAFNAPPASTCQAVSTLLTYAGSQSNSGGSSWYGQNKATQQLAKNTFDAINNQAAKLCP